jgi:membrane protease YdiL (CAAX protease family)
LARLRHLLRLAAALLIGLFLIAVANGWYLGGLQPAIGQNQDIFVGLSLAVIAFLWLWRSGYLIGVQSRGRLAALELGVMGALLVALTAFFGLGLNPLSLCLGGEGGFTCYAAVQGFLRGLLGLLVIVVGEEMFFVVYVTTELNRIIGRGALAVIISALVYSFSHLPVLQAEGFGSISSLWFLQILVGTSSLIACYWFTGRNLAAVIMLHAYWDGIGALVLFPNVGTFAPVALILGQLSLPAAVTIATHRLGVHRLAPGRQAGPEVVLPTPVGRGSGTEGPAITHAL